MTKLRQLMWLQIKLNLSLPQIKRNFKTGKGTAKNIFGVLLMGALLATIFGTYIYLLNMLFDTALKLNLATTVVSLTIFSGMLLVLVYGIFRNIGLYYSKDTEFLISLPIPKRTVYAAKFIVSYLGEIGVFSAMVLPPIILLGIKTSPDFFYWIKGILVCVLGPLAPYALASLLAAGLMRLSLFARHRDKIMTIGGFILLLAYIVFTQVLGQVLNHVDSNAIIAFLSGNAIEFIGKIFPPTIWASQALTYVGSTGLYSLVAFVGASLVGLIISVYVAGSAFSRGAVGQTETARKSKRIDMGKAAGDSRSPFMSLFMKEWKIMMRVPVYAMNGLIQVVMCPVMILLVFLVPTMTNSADGAEISLLIDIIRGPEAAPIFILVTAAVIFFMSSMNTAGSTSFSREGQAAWLLQTLPVRATTIAYAKLAFAISICFLSCILSWVTLSFVVKNPVESGLACLLAFVCSVPVIVMGNNVDMYRPRLKWESEQKAMKQNSNSFIAVLFTFLYMIGIGFMSYLLINDLEVATETVLIIVAGISLVLSALTLLLLNKTAQKSINAIGERD